MKMISNTRTTSTNGVTLISAIAGSPRDLLPPPLVRLKATLRLPSSLPRGPLDHVHEFERKIIKTVAHLFQLAAEKIVENGGRNRGNQTHARRDQRIRHARSHRREARASRRTQIIEHTHNSHHGSE